MITFHASVFATGYNDGMLIQELIPLAPLTTFKIGGAARYFCDVRSASELKEALVFARDRRLPVFMLGGGSNILVSDEGFDGLVIHLRKTAPDVPPTIDSEDEEVVVVRVDAGMDWDDFVVYAVRKNLYGIERLSGIPGTVGGAVVANIGAYGAQASDMVTEVEVIDRASENFASKVMKKNECAFAYHDSVFSRERARYAIVRATFTLHKRPTLAKEYRDNRFHVGGEIGSGQPHTLEEVREKVLAIREQKGALVMGGRTGFRCAGSFFHMPIVSKEAYHRVLAKAQGFDREKEERLRPWAWIESDGRYKIAPGFLLEYTQFGKGYSRGGVGISPRHILSIINLDHGTAREIKLLADDMACAVLELFDVSLEREVEYVGNL